jgi:3-hydroxyisobutyrate dehydrogenase/2-hydroxy-3-oxopropionate reductase
MLADPAALHAVVAGREGVAAGIRPGGTLIEMSTVGPGAVRELSTLLPTGVGLLDAPVLGSISEAESGSLEIFVGGDEALVARWEPLLSELGRPLRAGPLGAGAAAKLVANAALLGTVSLLGETLALSDALGLDRDRAFEVLALTPLAAQSERRRPAIESGEYPPRFRLSLARKDADLIRDSAPARLELPEAVRRRFAEAEERGLGDADYSAVLRSILD